MKPELGITRMNLKGKVVLLSLVLSNEMVLNLKSRKFYWNISGENLMGASSTC